MKHFLTGQKLPTLPVTIYNQRIKFDYGNAQIVRGDFAVLTLVVFLTPLFYGPFEKGDTILDFTVICLLSS